MIYRIQCFLAESYMVKYRGNDKNKTQGNFAELTGSLVEPIEGVSVYRMEIYLCVRLRLGQNL